MAVWWTWIHTLDHSITRHFQMDYVLFDAVFLAAFVPLLV